jgi:hypothetical protein
MDGLLQDLLAVRTILAYRGRALSPEPPGPTCPRRDPVDSPPGPLPLTLVARRAPGAYARP